MKKLFLLMGLVFVSLSVQAQSVEDTQPSLSWIIKLEPFDTFKMSIEEEIVSNRLKGMYPNPSFPYITINGVTTFKENGKVYHMVIYTTENLNKDYRVNFMEYQQFINWFK
jgi:hypothetical protein